MEASTPQIYLLSGPSGIGKSTALKGFVAQQRRKGKTFGGILQIVRNDKRHLHFLSSDEIKVLQLNDIGAHPKHHHHKHHHDRINDNKSIVQCGPFVFSQNVLNETQKELRNAYKYDYIIIDEIGPLELKKKKGYEPAITQILSQRKTKFKNTKFIIVVRPSLKSEIAKIYKLQQNEIGELEDIFAWKSIVSGITFKKILISSTLISMLYLLYKNRQ